MDRECDSDRIYISTYSATNSDSVIHELIRRLSYPTDRLEYYGVCVTDENGKFRSINDIFADLHCKVKFEDNTTRDELRERVNHLYDALTQEIKLKIKPSYDDDDAVNNTELDNFLNSFCVTVGGD